MPRKTFDLAALLDRFGLSHHAALVESALEPAVRMTVRDPVRRALPVGISRVGGEPDLNWAAPWPASREGRPMHFLAQFRLSDLREHLPRGMLPDAGWVRCWYDTLAERKWEEVNSVDDNTEWPPARLLLTFDADEERPLERRRWPTYHEKFRHPDLGLPWQPNRECQVAFQAVRSLPQAAMTRLIAVEEQKGQGDGWNRSYEFIRALHGEEEYSGNHQWLGDFFEVQGDLRFEAACEPSGVFPYAKRSRAEQKRLERAAREYRLLLRLDSDDRAGWGDCGALVWFLRRRDLVRHKLAAAVGVYD